MKTRVRRIGTTLTAVALGLGMLTAPTSATSAAGGTSYVAAVAPTPAAAKAASGPGTLDDPFYRWRKSLTKVKPGTVLRTRTVPYSIQGLKLPLRAVQILYVTRDFKRRKVVNATTVVRPVVPLGTSKVISYQSFYDSLNPADQPSTSIAGGKGLGPAIVNVETLLIAPALLAGYTVNIPDTQGQTANFAAGPEYGYTTLDSLRALHRTPLTGVGKRTPIGLFGYSGGAIGSGWAAELAATYAPAIARRIVGTAMGGVLVHPGRNLRYVEGSSTWAGVMPMAIIGVSRAEGIDLTPYLNKRGRQIFKEMRKAPISKVLGKYKGLMWKDMVKPRYDRPEKVRPFVKIANKLILSTHGTPSGPMFIGQGTWGEGEGTKGDKPGIGKGDGVMIAGDVRTMARRYCKAGVDVQYREYKLTHFTSIAVWLPEAYTWLLSRFGDRAAPDNCGSIAKGNPLKKLKFVKSR
ncbi:lipase family protein [Nocardioides alcanivorans]|uniref:lipase family protein n=1 Tax=Nocardioides alcanivorans TaxID=2897352 RepID=UPI001F32BE28|nr:lipase family protein [Nocardioides alcanivorans]